MCFAIICAWTGERELALEQLEAVTKTPGYHTYGNLRLNPMWDPLRGDPRFEKIVEFACPEKNSAASSNRAVVRRLPDGSPLLHILHKRSGTLQIGSKRSPKETTHAEVADADFPIICATD